MKKLKWVFPDPECEGDYPGLSQRELFAAMAMQAYAPTDADGRTAVEELAEEKGVTVLEFIAKMAVNQADALLAELAKDKS